MTIKRIDPNGRLSGVVVHGSLIYLSGQVPNDRSLDCEGQTLDVLEKIDRLLERVSSSREHLVSAHIWLKDIDRDFAVMNRVWSEWLPTGCAPARATTQATLASSDILVEIMVIAAIPTI